MKVKGIFLAVVPMVIGLFIIGMASCSKDSVEQIDGDDTTTVASRADLTNDSLFLYAKEIYYWNENLPAYDVFNPRRYSSSSTDLTNYENNLLAIAGYSTNGYDLLTEDNETYTKFSYIEDREDINPSATAGVKGRISAVNLEGDGYDVGIYFVAAVGTTANYTLYITAVYDNSPASKAGLTRGATITNINGTAIGSNFNNEVGTINNDLLDDPSSVTLKGKKKDGTDYEVTLAKTSYKSSPIYKDTIIERSGKKIGYLAYARFSTEDNSEPKLDSVFTEFASAGVTDLIIDLRYNGGGYVSTAEHLVNLIAPSTASGTMYTEYYNQTMRNGQATILRNQPLRDGAGNIIARGGTYADINFSPEEQKADFNKSGNVNVSNVVFLVTGSTASASELVVNSLLPVMNVKLVGTTTYGKPIGFFPIVLENRYDVYYSLFTTRNAQDVGDYYEGFTPGTDIEGTSMLTSAGSDRDYGNYDFGDEREYYLAEALFLLTGNSSSSTSAAASRSNKIMSINGRNYLESGITLNKKLGKEKEFKGMIENKFTK